MENGKKRMIDPDAISDQIDKELNPEGGSGGPKRVFGSGEKGGRRKKKQTEAITNMQKNIDESTDEEVNIDKNPSIRATIQRLIKKDNDKVNLPSLESYCHWILGIMTGKEYSKTNNYKIKRQKKSKGPGGQNTNKVASAVTMWHKQTHLKIQVADTRDASVNEATAIEIIKPLVAEHIKEWSDFIGKKKTEEYIRESIVLLLNEYISESDFEDINSRQKIEHLTKIKDVIARTEI